MNKIIKIWRKIKTWFYHKILCAFWCKAQNVLDKEPVIDQQEEDQKNAHCRRHYPGGRAHIINCWECSAEFRDDDIETETDDEDES